MPHGSASHKRYGSAPFAVRFKNRWPDEGVNTGVYARCLRKQAGSTVTPSTAVQDVNHPAPLSRSGMRYKLPQSLGKHSDSRIPWLLAPRYMILEV